MTKFIALVSGKGGVGKTTATINVGQALARLQKSVLLLDANLRTPNLAIHLGLINPEGTVNKFLRKEKQLSEVTYKHEGGFSLIPASSSYREIEKLYNHNLTEIFEHLDDTVDFVLIDASSGLGYEVSEVLKHSDEILLVVNPTVSSVMEALKTVKIAKVHDNVIAGIIVNMVHGRNELTVQQIEGILNHAVLTKIKYDQKIRKAVNQGLPLTQLYPRSRSAKKFKEVASYICLHN